MSSCQSKSRTGNLKPELQTLHFVRLWLAVGWVLVFVVVYLSLTPQPFDLPGKESDKIGHVLAYATLMLWFSQLYADAWRRVRLSCALVALGVGLEFAQRYTGYRSFELADMVAGAAGVAAGWCVAPPRGPAFLAYVDRHLGSLR
jgi:VanZ family protein